MPIRESITIEQALALLNEATSLDSAAIAALINNRVPCNDALAAHPTIRVRAMPEGCSVGLLGILNGLFGANENYCGPIAARFAVVCSHCDNPQGDCVGDPCGSCGKPLTLGGLLGFTRTPGV